MIQAGDADQILTTMTGVLLRRQVRVVRDAVGTGGRCDESEFATVHPLGEVARRGLRPFWSGIDRGETDRGRLDRG